MIGIEMKLNIPVHYQMGNPLQQGRLSDINLQAIYKVIHTSNLSTDWGQHFLQVY
jgi:hypothetical protein